MNVRIMNYERTKEEILIGFDKDSFTVEDKDEIYSLSFHIAVSRPLENIAYDLIENEAYVIFEGQEFIIKKARQTAKGSICAKEVTAIHISFAIQDGFQYEKITGTKSIEECLKHIFAADKQGFKYEVFNTNGVISRIEQENFGNADLQKLIDEVVKDYDVTIVRNNKLFSFYPNQYFETQTDNQIRYLYNTDDVSFEIDTYNFKTQIKGFGKRKDPAEGQTEGDYHFEPVVYTSPMAEQWGIRIQDSVEDDRYTVRANMIDRLKHDLQDYFQVSGSVSLKELDFDVKRGDKVRFIYEPLNINQFIRVVGITRHPFGNKPPEIFLDTSKKTMLNYVAALLKGGK